MTQLLLWNIRQFNVKDIMGSAGANAGLERYIVPLIVANPPAIIVILEVTYPGGTLDEGAIDDGTHAGPQGCVGMLNRLRRDTPTWCLIPPAISGGRNFYEAVAVFYDSAKVQFVGPYVYGTDIRTGGTTRAVKRATPSTMLENGPLPYPPPFANAINVQRPVPGARGLAAEGIPEDVLNGQWEFYPNGDITQQRIFFPDPDGPPKNNRALTRSPLYTEFIDLEDVTQRLIKLFSLHTSPQDNFSAGAVANFPLIFEQQSAAHTVVVFTGDFNIDSFQDRASLAPLIAPPAIYPGALTYTMLIDPAGNAANWPYCMTHIPQAGWLPYSSPPLNVGYPAFGYLNSAIDNAFVYYAPGTAGPSAGVTGATILNPVTGSPYVVPAGGPPAPPLGTAALGPYNAAAVPTGGALAPYDLILFNSVVSFVHGVSDHLPVLVNF
jgi:hypothetical protein